jgi:hypothetical protein
MSLKKSFCIPKFKKNTAWFTQRGFMHWYIYTENSSGLESSTTLVFLVSFKFTSRILSSLLSWCAKKAAHKSIFGEQVCDDWECWWWVWEKVLVVAWSEAVNVWKVSQVGWIKASRWSRFGWWLSMNHIAHTHTLGSRWTRAAQNSRAIDAPPHRRELFAKRPTHRTFKTKNFGHIEPKALCANSADLRVNQKCLKIKHAKPTWAH